ncbi:MAG: zeta toxin family protein, partial [Betaproteobacteria bacterium]|nr:zeta toxin family protein [Betaproteobacteria bacterium]
VLAAYAARTDTFGGRYVAADTFKELMPGFAESRESRNALNGAVHNTAAVLSSEQFRRVVEKGPQAGLDRVVFVTGIPGAGKSSTVANALQNEAGLVFEGQLSRPEPAMRKMEEAQQKGFKVEIVAVHVAPEVALERTNSRYLDPNNGRGASLNVMADIQGNLPAGLRQIQEKFGQSVGLTVMENNTGQQIYHEGWGAIPVLEKEGHREQIHQRLSTALDAGYRDGRYSDGFYTQAAGREPGRSMASQNRPEDGRGQQADGNRPGIPQADPKHDALNKASDKADPDSRAAAAEKVLLAATKNLPEEQRQALIAKLQEKLRDPANVQKLQAPQRADRQLDAGKPPSPAPAEKSKTPTPQDRER